jgi:hypothetical protein
MKHRFLIHELNHTVLVVDVTEIGLAREIYSPEGRPHTVPTLRFQSSRDAELYFLGLKVGQNSLNAAIRTLRKAGVAVLTIT